MRSVVLLDTKIDKDDALALLDEFGEFFEKYTGIECTWWVERRDFSIVPTEPDNDGDLKPTYKYRQALNKDVHDRYNDHGTDNVIMWVHEDNFLFKGIWGSNWSGKHFKHSFQLCRWDKDREINSFGTLYHELMHSFDWVIAEELRINIDALFGFDWDKSAVHGEGEGFEYIGRRTGKENTKYLKQVAPYLTHAFKKRKEKHEKYTKSLMLQIISLLRTILSFGRA